MLWQIEVTKTFSDELKKHKKDGELLNALDKKIQRLKENPENVGGNLGGRLHGYKSTRIIGKFRLIFKIGNVERKVYLCAIDHRKIIYDKFETD